MNESVTAWLPVYLSIACSEEEEVVAAVGHLFNNDKKRHYHPGKEKEEVFNSYFINYSEEAGLLLSEALEKIYSKTTSHADVSFLLYWKRFRSILNIISYHLTKKRRRERFMTIDRHEAQRKINTLIHPDCKGKYGIRLKGGNVLQINMYHSIK